MRIQIEDLNINYEIMGSGKTILLLHGWGCNSTFFTDIMMCLAQNHQVVALDFPGFGESDEPKYPWDVTDYMNFVFTFIEHLNLPEISLIGHSFGGRVIIKMAALEQEKVKINRIVLMDAAGIKPKKTLLQKVKIFKYKAGKKILLSPPIKKLYPDAYVNLQNKNGSQDYRNASLMMRQILVKTVNEDLSHLLAKIKQSTLLIWGELDTATPLSDAKIMEKLIPDSGLVVLNGASHFAYLEQKKYVGIVLNEFFKTYL